MGKVFHFTNVRHQKLQFSLNEVSTAKFDFARNAQFRVKVELFFIYSNHSVGRIFQQWSSFEKPFNTKNISGNYPSLNVKSKDT